MISSTANLLYIILGPSRDYVSCQSHRKEIDKNTYLHFKTFHSRTLRHNIPYGQFLRIRRNSTNITQFYAHSEKMFHDFIQRGYPENLVKDTLEKAASRDRNELLQCKRDTDAFKGIMAAFDYIPRAADITSIIRKYWHIVSDLAGCSVPPRIGLRKTSSIKNFVTNSDMKKKNTAFSYGPFLVVESVAAVSKQILHSKIQHPYMASVFWNSLSEFQWSSL